MRCWRTGIKSWPIRIKYSGSEYEEIAEAPIILEPQGTGGVSTKVPWGAKMGPPRPILAVYFLGR